MIAQTLSVERLSFFRSPCGNLRYAEHAPPEAHRDGPEHFECNCTKNATTRPEGMPSHVAQALRWTSEPDFGQPNGRLLVEVDERQVQWTYRWNDNRTRFESGDHAYFWFHPPHEGRDGRLLTPPGTELQVEITKPGYGASDHFFATLYVGNQVDTSAFFNGHSPSRVVDVATIHPEAVWIHVNMLTDGGERYAVLDDHAECHVWRDVFQEVERVKTLASPFIRNTKAPIADVYARAVADHRLSASIEIVTARLTHVLRDLDATALYRTQSRITEARA